MSRQPAARPLIVKRVRRAAEGHHGGAWKVAYADFVTAMMAFFLLMWLLNATSEEQRKGIADYFDPTLPISRTSAGGVGLLQGESVFSSAPMAGTLDRGVKRRPGEPVPERTDETATADWPDLPGDEGAAGTFPDAGQTAEAQPSGQAQDPALADTIGGALAEVEDAALRNHFRLRETPEGLVIEIVDLSEEPLFEGGSARPNAMLGTLLGILVPLLGRIENDIAIVGHTDSRPFEPGTAYTNWELSADRANAARRLADSLGLPKGRITRVSGMADTDPFDADPAAPQNRRIAVVLLREGRR